MPVARNWRASASIPTAATWSRQGQMARIPRRAHSSTMRSSRHCLRTVAVLIESHSSPPLKSRIR
jgi:hypothetical protein